MGEEVGFVDVEVRVGEGRKGDGKSCREDSAWCVGSTRRGRWPRRGVRSYLRDAARGGGDMDVVQG